MKTTVIHHSADYDGLFCREIARKFLPEAELIGWNFGDPLIPFPSEGTVYILDLSPECLVQCAETSRVIWIDHHKTAIEKFPEIIPGYRIDGVAACRLAWQWFSWIPKDRLVQNLPRRQDYLDRNIEEPLAVRLAGEYDIWDHRGDGDLEFQFGLRVESDRILWPELLDEEAGSFYVQKLIDIGGVAMRYSANVDAGMTKHQAFLLDWEGLKFLALNTGRFNSQTFAAKDVPETGHDALLGFNFNGKHWTVSMYHAAHRKDLDLSEIAKRHGGGGHKGACGFTCKTLPFAL